MTNQEFKMTTGIVVGIIVMFVNLIPSLISYGRGWNAWCSWLMNNLGVLAGTAFLTYVVLSIWQWTNRKNFKAFRKLTEKKWKNFVEEMTRED